MAVSQKISEHDHLGEEQSIWFKLSPLLKGEDPMQTLLMMTQKYGGIIPLNLKNQRLHIISKPEFFRHIMVTNMDHYVKYFEGMTPVFGKSMITVDGALWQKIRAPQQPAFHPNMFESYFPFLEKAVNKKMDEWDALCNSGDTVEMVEYTWTLAVDMVCQALFDREVPFNPDFVFRAVKTYTDVMNHKNIRQRKNKGAIESIQEEGAAKAMDTWGALPDRVLEAALKTNREDTLLKMIEAAENDPDFPEFDHQQTVDEMKQYLWAGTETTALTLAWSLYIAATMPEVKDKIRAEAEAVYGDEPLTFEHLQQLKYTKNVAQEVLRMFPPIWTSIRVCDKEDEIDGKKIMPGDKMILCFYAAHYDPESWTNPEVFDPTRFAPDRMRKRAKFSYLPFGGGRRSCIGGQLALVELTLALTKLLSKYEPEYLGETPAPISATVTLTPKNGLPFKVKRRE